MINEYGDCIHCNARTSLRCDHTGLPAPGDPAPGVPLCPQHRYAVHLTCLIRGESIPSDYLEEDLEMIKVEQETAGG